MNRTSFLSLAAAGVLGLGLVPQAHAAGGIDCRLDYQLSGWSIIYKRTSGTGRVSCDNGSSMAVKVSAHAVGLTVGKWEVKDGQGEFSGVSSIHDVLGTYAQASANAGAVKSGEAQVLTKGDVSLALAGVGEGVNIGVDIGGLTIEAAGK